MDECDVIVVEVVVVVMGGVAPTHIASKPVPIQRPCECVILVALPWLVVCIGVVLLVVMFVVVVVVVVVMGVDLVVGVGVGVGVGPTHTASMPVPIHRPRLRASGTLLLSGGA